ncbi:putative Replication factor C subunit 2 [Paratrimastix pyriformis]|uniref:Replication factor C subunit 2 n=1 Tax=Paratrimastix pyriformis TaxID=342808 RepID=A0ABQ8U2Q6_9EUKA|nr:putative Replication factor C subunit 2 [Paratrimastix pyriformis]
MSWRPERAIVPVPLSDATPATAPRVFPLSFTHSANRAVDAAPFTDGSVRLFDRQDLNILSIIPTKPGETCALGLDYGACFSRQTPHLLFTHSNQNTIRLWDTRSRECLNVITNDTPITCIDVNSDDTTLACGGEENLYFWDLRAMALRSCFSDSHSDLVTQVRFHPTNPNQLLSSSLDGLVCLFDLSLGGEDEALTTVINAETSVSIANFFGPQYENVLVLTAIETLSVWNAEHGNRMLDLKNARAMIPAPTEQGMVDYFVDAHYDSATQHICTIAGTHAGVLHIAQVAPTGLNTMFVLEGGHTDTVRCIEWDCEPGVIMTGGEDGKICRWAFY